MNKELNNEILSKLSSSFPNAITYINDVLDISLYESKDIFRSLAYLKEHSLITYKVCGTLGQHSFDDMLSFAITSKGLDTLLEDGGLSAELNTVTLKLDEESLKALLMLRINDTEMNLTQKQRIQEAIKDMPAESLRVVYAKILGAAFDSLPLLPALLMQVISTMNS